MSTYSPYGETHGAPPPPVGTGTRDVTAVMGRRILAWVIDLLLYAGIAAALSAAILEYVDDEAGFDDACAFLQERDPDVSVCIDVGSTVYIGDGGDTGLLSIYALAWFVLWYVVVQGLKGWSPGKLVTGLRVVDDQGRICGIGRSTARSLLWIVDAAPWLIPLVGFITGLTTREHRRVGDLAAKTRVVGRADVGVPAVGASPGGWPGAVSYGAPAPMGPPPMGTPPPPMGAPQPAGWGPPEPPAAAPPSAWGEPPVGATAAPWAAPSPSPSPSPAADWQTPGHAPPAPSADPWAPPPNGEPRHGSAVDEQRSSPAAPSPWEPVPVVEDEPASADEPTAVPAPVPVVEDEPAPAEEPTGVQAPVPDSEPTQWAAPGAAPPAVAPLDAAAPPADTTASLAPAAQPPAPSPHPPPQWDAARRTYIQWDVHRREWLQWDDAQQRWKPIDT